jgi:large subunit ribosomal protein L23
VAHAVEQTFKVTVKRVNVQHYRGKATRSRQGRPGQKSDFKKAIVTLKAGDKIELV